MAIAGEAFAIALNTTLERLTADGRPWCPPSVVARLPSIVAKRGEELGGLIRQAVRLQRLLARADRRGGIAALYVDLRRLGAAEFARLIDAALARGALAGVAVRQGEGVAFAEPAMAARAGRFDLSFAQMPLAASLLDAARNMLGFPAVEDMLRPLGDGRCEVPAEEIARSLDRALDAWLREHAEPEHLIKQKAFMFKFLGATRAVAARAIDDGAILDLWRWATGEASVCALKPDPIDGFRTYRSAAELMVILRHALEDALDAERMRTARSFGDPSDGSGDVDPATLDAEPLTVAEASTAWRRLTSPPADRVGWVKSRDDRKLIGDLLPGGDGDEDGEARGRGDLFDGSPPHPDLLVTFVRYATFGRMQTAIATALRFGRPAALQADGPLYEDLRARLAQIRDNLRDAALAAAHVLLAKGRTEGVELARVLAPAEVDRAIETHVAALGIGSARRDPGAALALLARTLANPQHPFGRTAKAAYGRIERAGFRAADFDDPAMIEALAAGSEALPGLLGDLDRVCARLARPDLAGAFAADRPIFEARFAALYAAPADPAAS